MELYFHKSYLLYGLTNSFANKQINAQTNSTRILVFSEFNNQNVKNQKSAIFTIVTLFPSSLAHTHNVVWWEIKRTWIRNSEKNFWDKWENKTVKIDSTRCSKFTKKTPYRRIPETANDWEDDLSSKTEHQNKKNGWYWLNTK